MINDPPGTNGSFSELYRAFLATVTELRPRLHRYCARMTGSTMDGEDVAQEALVEAYRKLGQFDDSRPLRPWLFRIAHNRCIDHLRRRDARRQAEAKSAAEAGNAIVPADSDGADTNSAIEHLVAMLPPKERGCVLLKDVLGHSLEEIATIVDSTKGGVKAALVRGRAKLAASPPQAQARPRPDPELSEIIRIYVDRFNRRDWNAVRELISADARCQVADYYSGPLSTAPYFSTYEKFALTKPWKMTAAEIEGEPAIVILLRDANDVWRPSGAVRFIVDGRRIVQISDYFGCPWVLDSAPAITFTGN